MHNNFELLHYCVPRIFIKVSKYQKHFYLKLIAQTTNEILKKTLPYEARAEFCQIVLSFFAQLFFLMYFLFFGLVYISCMVQNSVKFQKPKSSMFGQIFYHNVEFVVAIIKKWEILKPYLPVCYTMYLHGEVWKRNVRYLIYVSGICYFKVHRRYS